MENERTKQAKIYNGIIESINDLYGDMEVFKYISACDIYINEVLINNKWCRPVSFHDFTEKNIETLLLVNVTAVSLVIERYSKEGKYAGKKEPDYFFNAYTK